MYKIKLSQSNYTLSKPIRILTYWSPRNFENEEYEDFSNQESKKKF